VSDAISKLNQALEICKDREDIDGNGNPDAWMRVATLLNESLQAMQGDAFMYGTGISQGGKHIPTKDFYQQPAVPEEWVEAVSSAAEYIKHLQESPNTRSLQGAVLLAGFDDLLSAAKGEKE